MKKKLVFIFCAVIICALIVIAMLSMTTQDKPAPYKLFAVLTYDDLKDVAQENKLIVEQTNMGYLVEEANIFGETMAFSYFFDQNQYLSELTAYSTFQADNLSAFETRVSAILGGFAELFGISADQYYVYSSSDVYDCKDELSMDRVFSGEATIEFRLRDKESSCWIIKIVNTNPDVFLCTIEHFVNNSRFDNVPVNVDLS